jgi:alanyl-tRNA synthetase
MRSTQIRSTFLDFFAARGHRRVPSSPLIPADPTLLLTNAGMNQFKPYFLGEVTPEFSRATSLQKCARTSDIENVGRTNRHATFFEMLGNFSFGDYFKADAIAFAWELLTDGYGLEKDRLWITVYQDDDEAERLWRAIGVPSGRIQRLGREDNFWSMGVPGPCGPCSEVTYDRGPAFGREGGPAVDGERYVEIWNLVFMQHERGEGDAKGDFPITGDLARRSIDTGLGLDRLAAILQGAENVCGTDLLLPTLATVQELAARDHPGDGGGGEGGHGEGGRGGERAGGRRAEDKVSFQVVTEHARSLAFLIADGVLPAKDGRGYVLRRLARRAVRHARLLGIEGPVLPAVTASVVANLGDAWPELATHAALIEQVVTAEEESFTRALGQGTRLLDAAITRSRAARSTTLPGETAFELHDTYGFPVELTVEAARDAGLTVDEDRFATLLAEQRRRARTGGRARTAEALRRLDAYREVSARHGRTEFVGYDRLTAEATVLGVIADGTPVPGAEQGTTVELVLDRSPFYAESGGQVGDTGTVRTPDGALLEIRDTRPGLEGLHVHTARVLDGELRVGDTVEARVDGARRAAVARSHSATHVLHAVLRRTLGDHTRQHGSLVDAGRLRFDFTHFSALDPAHLAAVEALVNDHLLADPEVRVWHATRAEAEAAGATALFGEKYGDQVRVVDIGDFSRELCGGTHVGHGAGAGPVRILGESSIGANLRRVEALTGRDALAHHDTERRLLDELAALLGTSAQRAPDALRKRLDTLAAAQRDLARLHEADLHAHAARLAASSGGPVIAVRVPGLAPDDLRTLATTTAELLDRDHGHTRAAVILGTEHDGRALLAAAVTPGLHASGVQAAALLAPAARAVGGGAGGRGPVASAGGRRAEGLNEALRLAAGEARRVLGG